MEKIFTEMYFPEWNLEIQRSVNYSQYVVIIASILDTHNWPQYLKQF